jgi:hypothetical protein
MPDSKTYTGGCHCGQVRFECTTDLAMVTACNCSICTKRACISLQQTEELRAARRRGEFAQYLFNKHAIRTSPASTAGSRSSPTAPNPTADVVALNVNCIDVIDLANDDIDSARRAKPVGPATPQALTSPAGRGEMEFTARSC